MKESFKECTNQRVRFHPSLSLMEIARINQIVLGESMRVLIEDYQYDQLEPEELASTIVAIQTEISEREQRRGLSERQPALS